MNAKWSERGREIILKLIALPVPLLRQVASDGRLADDGKRNEMEWTVVLRLLLGKKVL